jgi:hypothetical protein
MNTSILQSSAPAAPLCQIVTPVGMMGYGFPEDQVEAALEIFSHYPTPTAIILDAGSTDSGPSKLAIGTTTCPRSSYVRDFRKLLTFSIKYSVPLLLSSAGGDGSDEHVDLFLEIIREITQEPGHELVSFTNHSIITWLCSLILVNCPQGLEAEDSCHLFRGSKDCGCGEIECRHNHRLWGGRPQADCRRC